MTTIIQARMGDVVQLRDDRVVVVESNVTSYHDADGDHEGPFIRTSEGEFVLAGDVAFVVNPNPRICTICGDGVTASNEETDFCRNCYYSGAATERDRAEQLAAISTALDGPTVAVEHTGGGCFWVAVRFDTQDEGGEFYVLTDGDASLPEQAEGGWRYIGLHSDDEDSPHYEGTALHYLDGAGLTDEQAVRAILRHRRGHRPYPSRGQTRIQAQRSKGASFENSSNFRLTIPAALARAVGPDALFEVETTAEGILFRWVGGKVVGRPNEAEWLR